MPQIEPQFFDIFGILTFLYIIALGWWGMSGKRVERWMYGILFLIGLLGLLVDGSIVSIFYLK